MNNSSGTNNSPGFVYFNVNSSQQNNRDTQDFLSFNDSSPVQNSHFSPSNYSSPQKYQRSPRNYNNRYNRNSRSFTHGYNNKSFNSSNNRCSSFSYSRSFNNSPSFSSFNEGHSNKSQNKKKVCRLFSYRVE